MPIRLTASQIDGWNETYYGGGAITSGGSLQRGNTGYVKLEGGFIMQYGQCTTAGTGRYDSYVSFPFTFTTVCLGLAISEAGAGGWGLYSATLYCPTLISNSGFYFQGAWITNTATYYASSIGGAYIAIGY